jgi:hypothetical protein
MAFIHSPKVVTSNLSFYVDAANKNSYKGSGTSWNDLSGNDNNTTLNNGPTFNGSKGGNILFDGVDDYVSIPNTINLGNTFTISSFIRLTSDNGDTSVTGTNANGSDNWFGINSNKIYLFYTRLTDVDNTALLGATTLSNGIFYQITAVINGATSIVYLNGVQDGTRTESFTIASWNGAYAIGRRSSDVAQRYFNGNIANVVFYNRVLTAAEILRNFNATKTRFGL